MQFNPGLHDGQAVFQLQQTQGHVLCCLCGTSIAPNPSNMCVSCIRTQVDITEGIQKQVTILWCKDCNRYLQPPKHWVRAELESKELLTFCVKRIKGLQKVKLVDAGFIWTEPHSKRLKVKVLIQAEVMNGAILQQGFVVEYVVENHMCMDCTRANTNANIWAACVQVRQHVPHKRTFLFLEQLILKHNADAQCTKVKDIHEGVDFFFAHRAHGVKLIDFLQSVVPARFRHDKQLVSHDTHTTVYNYKYTFSVEIAPICKDDLVCLPAPLCKSLGSLGPLVLVTRVTNAVTLTDPTNLRGTAMDAATYWRQPFRAMMSSRQLVEYVVLDIEPVHQQGGGWGGSSSGRFSLAEATVARASDFGRNDTTYFTRTHLGNVLHPGDMCWGYDMANANSVGLDFDAFINRGGTVPDVILVRKSYEEKRKRRGRQTRAWKLKRLDMEIEGERGRNEATEEADRERFMEELEEDADMRARVNLYKDSDALQQQQAAQHHHHHQQQQQQAAQQQPAGMASEDEDDAEGLPQVPLDELLDDLEALGIDEGPGGATDDDDDDDDVDDEDMMDD